MLIACRICPKESSLSESANKTIISYHFKI